MKTRLSFSFRRRKDTPNSKNVEIESKNNLNVMNLKHFEMGSKNEVFEGDEDETLNEKVASSPPQEKPVSIIHRRRSSGMCYCVINISFQ